MSNVTRILSAIERGDERATDKLLPLVYEELRLLAAQRLSREAPGQTLQATALVHEAYIRLVGGDSPNWDCQGHFFAAAAEAMRRILVERARRKKNLKNGGEYHRLGLEKVTMRGKRESSDDYLLALDEALEKLSRKDGVKAELVKLRYFAGLTGKQAAEVLGISSATADRYWKYARCWLRFEITKRNKSI
ncbi:MAG: sigma-70 family RNA polymerase sigma factor [Planctomycetota bacterium]|jgi:RNA polymerase sigma factor (TIGR02999 family)